MRARVRDGRLELGAEIRLTSGGGEAVGAERVLDYTLRTGVAAELVDAATVTRPPSPLPFVPPSLRGQRSALVWLEPELRLSLGVGLLSRLLPKLWMPVLSATCVLMPACVLLRRVGCSDAAGGVAADGTIDLGLGRQRRQAERDGGGALPTT